MIDLEIRIFGLEERGYPVEITLDGQQEFPRGYLTADIVPWAPTDDPESDGRRLFDTLFADADLRAAWAQAVGQSRERRIRLRIDPAAAELHTLPWELLHDGTAMLSAQDDTPFSRYLPIALPWSGAVEERPVRVLVVVSNPADLESRYNLPPVDVERERAALEAAFSAVGDEHLAVRFLDPPVTLRKLEHALREGYHVLHFLGHGAFSRRRGQAALYFQDEEGNGARVLDDDLVNMLARHGARPRLIVLVACQSATRATTDAFLGLAPKLVRVGVPAVVAMQDVVTMETGRRFGAEFYSSLLATGQVDLAVNQARSTLLTDGRPDVGVPVLFMRLKSGQLWSAEADARGAILGTDEPAGFWRGLIRNITRRRSTPIIGPRVRGRWIPSPAEIASLWADEYDYPYSDRENLPRVLEYIAVRQGEMFPREEMLEAMREAFEQHMPSYLKPEREYDTLGELVAAVGWESLTADDPNEIHRVLASLDLPLYVTTNFDNFLAAALKSQGKKPVREICRWDEMLDDLPSVFEERPDYVPSPEEPLVYHLFGNEEEPDSLVLTEDDHLDFLVRISAEPERIPNYVRAALANNSLIILGYGLNDWGFRVILRGLMATTQRRRRRSVKHIGVQLDPRDVSVVDAQAAVSFLEDYLQEVRINVYSGTTQQFIAELREWWERERAADGGER